MSFKIKRYPFYVGITTLVVAIVVVLTGLFQWISHRESTVALRVSPIGIPER